MRSFDRLAPFYDKLAKVVFRGAIRNSQLAYLQLIPPNSKVLLLGGGTGWILQEMPIQKAAPRITYLESSPAMIARAQARVNNITNIDFRLEDFLVSQLDEYYDVVVTNFFLDVFRIEDLSVVIEKINGRLKPQGLWLISDFELRQQMRFRFWKGLLIKIMYIFFRQVTGIKAAKLPEIEKNVSQAGYRLEEKKYYFFGMIASWSFAKVN